LICAYFNYSLFQDRKLILACGQISNKYECSEESLVNLDCVYDEKDEICRKRRVCGDRGFLFVYLN
jgi:hypothetical protein